MGELNRTLGLGVVAGLFAALLYADAAHASAWQAALEGQFDIVDTFDDLEDWTPGAKFYSGSGCATCLSNMDLPRKLDGTPSIWGLWNNKGLSFQYTPQAGVFVAGDVIRGATSGSTATVTKVWNLDGKWYIQLTSNDGVTGRSALRAGETITSGSKSGANLQWPLFIANHGPARIWGGSGKSLVLDLGDNSNSDPANPTMEGLGAQRLGTYFGNGVSGGSGYKKVHVFFMMKISPSFFLSCRPGETGCIQGGYAPVNVVKVFDLMSGFTGVSRWGTAAEAALAGGPNLYRLDEYGQNFSIFNFGGGGNSFPQSLFFSENIRVSTSTAAGYDYAAPVNGRRMRSGTALDLERYVRGGEWFGVEVAADIGTRGMNDGSTDLWIYDSSGREMGHFSVTGENRLMNFDHRYNKFVLGGNRLSKTTATAGIDSRWWVDDVVIHGSRIGTSYFQMLAARGTPNPVPEADTVAPVITSFILPATATSRTVPVTLAASDSAGVAAYRISESPATPLASAGDWLATKPVSFTFAAAGARTAYAWAKDAAGNVSAVATARVTITLPDVTAPTVAIAAPTANSTVKDLITIWVNAADNVGIAKLELYIDGVLRGVNPTAIQPLTFTWDTRMFPNGTYNLSAKAYDAAGNAATSAIVPVTFSNPADTVAPAITSFTLPATATSRTVPVTLAASDFFGIAGYRISESSVTPLANASGWVATRPTSFTFAGAGARTAYAWAKDPAGNVSAVASARVTIVLPDATGPTVTGFTMPATARSFTVPIRTFTASDNVGVTGYIVTESPTRPSATAAGWRASPPLAFTFSATGVRTAYAWAKDAAGNVSFSYKSAQVIVDGTAPVITAVSPTGGTFWLSSTITIAATATDAIALSRMTLSIDSIQRTEVAGGRLTYYWRPTSRGTHTFSITAYDKSGNRAVRTVSIYVR